ncbi:MAG: hypothetical protein NT165_02910 [Candidatus Falkowbacteria bacterium]|nr:hypothetical protein [Candidatus Falkowbacteria bacterium]
MKKAIIIFISLLVCAGAAELALKSSNKKIQGEIISGKTLEDLYSLHQKKDSIYVIGEVRLRELKKEILQKYFPDEDSLQFKVLKETTQIGGRIAGSVFREGVEKLFVISPEKGIGYLMDNDKEQIIKLHVGFISNKIYEKIGETAEENFKNFGQAQIWLSTDAKKIFIFSGEKGETKEINPGSGEVSNLGPFYKPNGKILLERAKKQFVPLL